MTITERVRKTPTEISINAASNPANPSTNSLTTTYNSPTDSAAAPIGKTHVGRCNGIVAQYIRAVPGEYMDAYTGSTINCSASKNGPSSLLASHRCPLLSSLI